MERQTAGRHVIRALLHARARNQAGSLVRLGMPPRRKTNATFMRRRELRRRGTSKDPMRTRDEDIRALEKAVEDIQSADMYWTKENQIKLLKAQVRLLVLYATSQAPMPPEAFKLLRESIE